MNRLIGTVLFLAITLSASAQKDRYAQPELPGDLRIDIGMNFLRDAPEEIDVNVFNSRSVGIYYGQTFKLSNYFTFNPAIGITAEKIRNNNDQNFQIDANNDLVFDTLQNRGNIKTNKLAVNYLEIPFELRFYPTKTIDGEGLFVGIGGIIGARLESHTKIKYDTGSVNRGEKLRDRFGLEDFRFGLQGRVGLNGLHLFAKYYLTDMFRPDRAPGSGGSPSMLTIGLNISGF